MYISVSELERSAALGYVAADILVNQGELLNALKYDNSADHATFIMMNARAVSAIRAAAIIQEELTGSIRRCIIGP